MVRSGRIPATLDKDNYHRHHRLKPNVAYSIWEPRISTNAGATPRYASTARSLALFSPYQTRDISSMTGLSTTIMSMSNPKDVSPSLLANQPKTVRHLILSQVCPSGRLSYSSSDGSSEPAEHSSGLRVYPVDRNSWHTNED
jgi:hypothetical protein